MRADLFVGDARVRLLELAAAGVRVQTIVTSPPYWSKRDYKAKGQLGLEPKLSDYVENLVGVLRLARDVLADDGTLWLNMGDTFVSDGGAGWQGKNGTRATRRFTPPNTLGNTALLAGLKPKDLALVPARVALALQADGWWVRNDIIWQKPNPMPESAKDRCTVSHEHVYLLSKKKRYFYDWQAIAEPAVTAGELRWAGEGSVKQGEANKGSTRRFGKAGGTPSGWQTGKGTGHRDLTGRHGSGADWHHKDDGRAALGLRTARGMGHGPGWRSAGASRNQERSARPGGGKGTMHRDVAGSVPWQGLIRNRRDVWLIPTQRFVGAHFATFPEALVEPCILAGSRVGDTVLDLFAGAGTVGVVALRRMRNVILIELSRPYVGMAAKRIARSIAETAPLFHELVVHD